MNLQPYPSRFKQESNSKIAFIWKDGVLFARVLEAIVPDDPTFGRVCYGAKCLGSVSLLTPKSSSESTGSTSKDVKETTNPPYP